MSHSKHPLAELQLSQKGHLRDTAHSAGAIASAAAELIQGTRRKVYNTVSGPPSTITDTGPAICRIRSKQQLDTNQEIWWNSDYLQAVRRLRNMCLPASRLISLIAWALQKSSSPLCLRWRCVHSSPSTLKESKAGFNIHLSKEALTEQNPEPSFSLDSSLFV